MATLAGFLVDRTAWAAEQAGRRDRLVAGIVVRADGGQFLVNVGGQTVAAQPVLGLPLLPGDQVWLQYGLGQPKILGVGSRNSEVT